VRPNETDKLETLVDADTVIIAGVADAVHKQCLDVWFQRRQLRVVGDQRLPALQGEQRLGSPRGTGIESDYAVLSGSEGEKGQIDRDEQRVPLRVGHPKVFEQLKLTRHAPVRTFCLMAEQDRAGFAAAE